jgi:uncharacterized protein (DUF433 family)
MPTTATNHITIDEKGVARIDGSRMKVLHVAEDKRFNDTTPEQMQRQWPHLTLAQIHAALAYYYDHQQELDSKMDQDYAEYLKLREQAGPSPLREKLSELRARAEQE